MTIRIDDLFLNLPTYERVFSYAAVRRFRQRFTPTPITPVPSSSSEAGSGAANDAW
jgi:hypothetical protein